MDGVVIVTDERTQSDQIERGEQWFSRRLERSVAVDTTEIKKRIRIEINERWLAQELGDDESSDLASRVRSHLKAHVVPLGHGAAMPERSPRGRVYRLYLSAAGVVGVAAAIGWIWMGNPHFVPTSAVETAETSYADAFEQFSNDDFDESLSDLGTELDQFVAKGTSLSWDEDMSDEWFATTEDDATDG